jgi:hypothetical protein
VRLAHLVEVVECSVLAGRLWHRQLPGRVGNFLVIYGLVEIPLVTTSKAPPPYTSMS